MEDLLLLICAIIVGLVYEYTMKPVHTEDTFIPVPRYAVNSVNMHRDTDINTDIVDNIRSRIFSTFHGNDENKREKIVSLLIQYEKIGDPDEFFEENDFIREYIFQL